MKKLLVTIAMFSLVLVCLTAQTTLKPMDSLISASPGAEIDPGSSDGPYRDVVATPVFDPPGGTYCTQQFVEITTTTYNATVRYTLDGSDPTLENAVYTAPIPLPYNSSYTIKSRAWCVGYEPSEVAVATYIILNSAYPVQITSEPSDAVIWLNGEATQWTTPHTFCQDTGTDAVYLLQLAEYTWEPASFAVNNIQTPASQHFIGTHHYPPLIPGVDQTIGGPNFYIASITVATPPDTGFPIDYDVVNINTIPPYNNNNGLSYHNSYAVVLEGPADAWFDLEVTVPAGIWWICAWWGDAWHRAVPHYPYIGDVPGTVYLMHAQFASTKGPVYMVVAQGEGLDITLPVELSSFTGIATADHFVDLQWTTQSEANLIGYYINRNKYDTLDNSNVISPLIAATNSSQVVNYSFTDAELDPGCDRYYYWLQMAEMDGSIRYHGPISVNIALPGDGGGNDVPQVTKLLPVYPNPFNPSTCIPYQLRTSGTVEFGIYNCKGQLVRSYQKTHAAPGTFKLTFDGMDANGNILPSGLYYCTMTSEIHNSTVKMVLLK